MKYLLFVFALGLVGCQSRPAPTVLPIPATAAISDRPPAAPPAPPPSPSTAGLEAKVRQLTQYIEALISQNDALTAQLAAIRSDRSFAPSAPAALNAVSSPPTAIPVPPLPLATEPTLTPNAQGVIDLAAAAVAEVPGEPVNPFTVRTVAPDSAREVAIQVGGVVAGPVACAVVNDRLVQAGEAVDSFTVERIETDAVLLRHSGRLLRLPVAEKATRVRLPL